MIIPMPVVIAALSGSSAAFGIILAGTALAYPFQDRGTNHSLYWTTQVFRVWCSSLQCWSQFSNEFRGYGSR